MREITYKKFLFVFLFQIGQLNGPLHLNGTSFHSITIIVDNVPELRALLLESRKPFRLVKKRGENEIKKLNENMEIVTGVKKKKVTRVSATRWQKCVLDVQCLYGIFETAQIDREGVKIISRIA